MPQTPDRCYSRKVWPLRSLSLLVQSTLRSLGSRSSLVSLGSMVQFQCCSKTSLSVIPAFVFDVVNAYHVFCSARIIYLLKMFNMRDSAITKYIWSLLRYTLSSSLCSLSISVGLETIQAVLPHISLDQLVVCAFFAVCRIFCINISFHNLLDVYLEYLTPFQSISNLFHWGDVNRLWLAVDLSFVSEEYAGEGKTMVDLYNIFFVPNVLDAIRRFQAMMHVDERTTEKRGTK